ncbi:hypothetical protein Ocin01_15991 [Orchesella cincta]|uniref:Uncharacterized protein n=1 Tax=Orchesella cincta TaxID=48709 RepID=A0A1D2MCJ4_ORCCI|nr:hypothetical protein Ocin01_15991 [Orchesella cincta]
MSHKILFAMFLSLLGKQAQVDQLFLEVKECTNLSNEIMAQFKAATGLKITLKSKMEIQQVREEALELMKLHLEFYRELNEFNDPVEDLVDMLLRTIQTTRQQSELEEDDLEELAQQFVDNENLQKILSLDVTKFQTEWNKLNLTLRLRDCSNKLSDLTAQLPDETVSELDVVLNLKAKQDTLFHLLQQGLSLNGILTEIERVSVDKPKTDESKIELLLLASRLETIWEEFQDYMTKIYAASKTLNDVKLSADTYTSTAELIQSGRLLSDESIRAAYEIDVNTLKTEWDQLDLIQRAKVCLAEWKSSTISPHKVNQQEFTDMFTKTFHPREL